MPRIVSLVPVQGEEDSYCATIRLTDDCRLHMEIYKANNRWVVDLEAQLADYSAMTSWALDGKQAAIADDLEDGILGAADTFTKGKARMTYYKLPIWIKVGEQLIELHIAG